MFSILMTSLDDKPLILPKGLKKHTRKRKGNSMMVYYDVFKAVGQASTVHF